MPVAQVNGVRLNYVQMEPAQGRAREDLVMVHGLATNMAFWYFRYAPVFSQRYRVTLFDLRGHGRSDMPESGYTPHNLAVDLQRLLDHLGIERAHFVAHSFGGVITLNLACFDPERIASLILADTHISAVRRQPEAYEWGYGNEIQPVLDRHGLSLDTRDPYFGYRLLTEVARLQLKNAKIPPALLELVSPLIGKHGNRTATQWLKLMHGTRAEQELMGDDGLTLEKMRNFSFPLLAMYGDKSQAKLTGKQLLEVWPQAEFRRVRDAGHFFPASKPEEVIATCQRFWGGEFAHKRRHRHGEIRRSHFRGDRTYQLDGAWYCSTRESTQIGPFAELGEAEKYLASHIAEIAAGAMDASHCQ
jgi:pimeloyl-ACP methyl ester carboxylesterase